MSPEFLDYPEDEPEVLSHASYGEAYCAYMEAMALRDIADLTQASHILEGSDFPLIERIDEYTDLLNDALLESDSAKFNSIAACIFPDLLRSYVYSGVEIDAPLINFFTELSGHDMQWLRGALKPGPTMYLHLGANIDDFARTQELRYYGRRGLLQLGLGSIGMKLSARFGFLNYSPMAPAKRPDLA